jgi:hypothetical protein
VLCLIVVPLPPGTNPFAVKINNSNNNNNNNWNHFKILQKILEQRTGKARYQGTTENSCTGHSTHTAGSADVEAQKGLILQTALYAPLTVRAG